MVETPEDEALAERPRADVDLLDLEQVEGGLGDERAESRPASRPTMTRRSSRVSERRTKGPSSRGAAPAMRASERIVFEVPTARSGTPDRSNGRICSARVARTYERSSRAAAGVGGSWGGLTI